MRLSTRQSGAGAYSLLLDVNGQVSLLSGSNVIGSAVTAPAQSGAWRTIGLSVLGNKLSVTIDNIQVITVQDAAPLPQGTFSVAGINAGTLLLDDVTVETPFIPKQNSSTKATAEVPVVTGTARPALNSFVAKIIPATSTTFVGTLVITNLSAVDGPDLSTQISYANTHCPSGQAYTITLTGASPYNIANVVENFFGDNGLPVIHCDITIIGMGKIIQRTGSASY